MSRNLWHINTLEKISIPRMVIQNNNKRKLHIVEKFTEFAYWCHDFLSGGRVVVLVRWCRWVKGLAAPLVMGIQVLSCHCVNGDGKTVQEKKKRAKAVQKMFNSCRNRAERSSPVESHGILRASARVHVCIPCVSACVFVYSDRRISLSSLALAIRGERGGEASHPLCFILSYCFISFNNAF